MLAVVNLLPRVVKSGGGGKGWPVAECCSALLRDDAREFKLDRDE